MIGDIELLYRQHLSEADRRLMVAIAGSGTPVSEALGDPRLEAAVFSAPPGDGPRRDHGSTLAATTPFLTFAVAVHRTAVALDHATFIEEPWGRRQRIPVFDVGPLRELLAAPARRFFLVELLASYTHISSGATWERTRRGWRRRRFSELDPVRLAGLLEVVEATERPGIYRRLGDLALFLTGVFPDHPALVELSDAALGRLLRLSGLRTRGELDTGRRELIEYLGNRWYRLAVSSARTSGAPVTAGLAVIEEMGTRFADARRVLNVLTDRYLFPVRQQWFGMG